MDLWMSKVGRTFTVIKILISDKVFYSKVLFKSHPSQVPVMEGEEGSRSRSKFARLVNKDGVINITYRTLLWSNPLTRIFEGSVRAYSSSFWLATLWCSEKLYGYALLRAISRPFENFKS